MLACCDVIFESDVTAADIMYEICQNILKHHQIDSRVRDALKSMKLTPQSANLCREEILARCGIDLSTFLAERERLGKSYKQVLEEIRSFNSSLCLKIHFRIPLSQLGTPHLIRNHILMPHSKNYTRFYSKFLTLPINEHAQLLFAINIVTSFELLVLLFD